MRSRYEKTKAAPQAVFVFFLLISLLCQLITPSVAAAKDLGFTDKTKRPPCPFKITQVRPDDVLTKVFKRQPASPDWTGGDAAYSIELSPGRTLWLFGDSFIGTIKDNKRIDSTMVHNALAIEEGKENFPGKLSFFYGYKKTKTGALSKEGFFQCPDEGAYYWPGDGFVANGKLFLFMHVVRTDRKLAAPFQFELCTDHLITVSNPQDSPSKWKCQIDPYHNSAKRFLYGSACCKDNKYAYIFCTNGGVTFNFFKHPICAGRIALYKTENLKTSKLEWWSDQWRHDMSFLETLFEDGAAEMSVTRIQGLTGYFAFYIPPDKQELMMRYAPKPEGPWTDRQVVYHFPKTDSQIFYYSAKAHPQYSKKKGEIVLTYCTNHRNFSRLTDSALYRPLALKVSVGAADGKLSN